MNGILKLFLLITLGASTTTTANTFTLLDSYGGDVSYPTSVNDLGQVVGYSNKATASTVFPTLWNGSSPQELALPLGGIGGVAVGINNNGQVAGSIGDGTRARAVRWDNGIPNVLSDAGGSSALAMGINNSGQVVGGITFGCSCGYNHPSPTYSAVRWDSNSPTLLNAPSPNLYGFAFSINSKGQVVGYGFEDPSWRANYKPVFLWGNGFTMSIYTPGQDNLPRDINDSGQIVGMTTGSYHATLWNGISSIDLGTLPDARGSSASAINNFGDIVGGNNDWEYNSNAVLWHDGEIFNLNDLIDPSIKQEGWILANATDISDTNWVVGTAHNQFTHENRGFSLLISDPLPIPEPQTNTMLITGLGLLTLVLRRRNQLHCNYFAGALSSALPHMQHLLATRVIPAPPKLAPLA